MAMLEGRVALVTGAASGIGLATARTLAQAGASVTLTDVNSERGQAETARLPGARFIAANLTDPGAAGRLISETLATSGRLDILINNAGVQFVSPIHEF